MKQTANTILHQSAEVIQHFHRPIEREFTLEQRAHTTIFIGGLTWRHERLIKASLDALGYHIEVLATPTVTAFQTGKEFGNNGQCNPTYFTVGSLVERLQNLEKQGLSKKAICDKYVFLTAGACGPCRFGMYEAEFRLALNNAGFGDFRVLIFQQKNGFDQGNVEAGLNLNTALFLSLLNALTLGDLLSDIAFQVRPYEINKGQTEQVLQQSVEMLAEAILSRQAKGTAQPTSMAAWQNHLTSSDNTKTLSVIYQNFKAIPVDYFESRPIVKITGEFWAQTTEGDGNYNMFSFLENEGAQVLVEPIGTWILYMLHQVKQKARDHMGLVDPDLNGIKRITATIQSYLSTQKKILRMTIAEKLFNWHWQKHARALGDRTHKLTNQYELQRIGHPYYNSRAQGGEGHLEVAKNIYYTQNNLAHMILSLKPFGCMPSTQSDGVQSIIVNQFSDMIYLPVETSGEGEVNAHSRVQMALGEAFPKCRDEFQKMLDQCKFSLDEMRKYVSQHPKLSQALLKIPQQKGVTGTSANYIHYIDSLMQHG